MMTDRPILFSGEMVRAILDGRKTQTRRVMKVQPWPNATVEVGPYHPHRMDRNGESQPGPATFGAIWDHQDIVNGGDAGLRCPYGKPGDQLWVRETWKPVPISAYRCSEGVQQTPNPQDTHEAAVYKAGWDRSSGGVSWRPSIYMPRWASRITLRITDIRVERLQDISEDDARAEGVTPATEPPTAAALMTAVGRGAWFMPHRGAFANIWNKINAPGAWDENPWVWAISFERVKP
jgi:hypothetical protein